MTLLNYLLKYYDIEPEILLVFHPTEQSSWRDRCYFLDEEYDAQVKYNHRSILKQEVVLEFDEGEPSLNRELCDIVSRRLTSDKIVWSKWFSGNKSYHLHFFVDIKEAKRLNILKSVILSHYGTVEYKGQTYKPDLQLAANNHNIRAEYGIHEKTGKTKKLISVSGKYPTICSLPPQIWDKYSARVKAIAAGALSRRAKSLEEHPVIKLILNTTEFRKNDDGRERALFVLIHVLKEKFKGDKQKFTKFLQEWYRYSGGRQLSDWAIQCKINYHWEKQYNITHSYLENLAYELGIKEG